MKTAAPSRRDRLRHILADLKMPARSRHSIPSFRVLTEAL